MATLSPAFRIETQRIHSEHQILEYVLSELDEALDSLACYGEVFADFRSAGQLRRSGRQLTQQFPEHCRREEANLLDPVADVSPELAEFCGRMKGEHADLLVRLAGFRTALDDFERTDDLAEAICRLKEQGKELTRDLRRHVETEERELSGFL